MAALQVLEVATHSGADLFTVITTVATVVMAVAVVFGGLRWIFSQGGQNRAHIEALNRNVSATNELTDTVKELDKRVTLADAELGARFGLLEGRVAKTEWSIERLTGGS